MSKLPLILIARWIGGIVCFCSAAVLWSFQFLIAGYDHVYYAAQLGGFIGLWAVALGIASQRAMIFLAATFCLAIAAMPLDLHLPDLVNSPLDSAPPYLMRAFVHYICMASAILLISKGKYDSSASRSDLSWR